MLCHCEFLRLPVDRQLDHVFNAGTRLTSRWVNRRFVDVYGLAGGFFAEVAYDVPTRRVVLVRSYDDTGSFGGTPFPPRVPQRALA
jgi:hypothetical protein